MTHTPKPAQAATTSRTRRSTHALARAERSRCSPRASSSGCGSSDNGIASKSAHGNPAGQQDGRRQSELGHDPEQERPGPAHLDERSEAHPRGRTGHDQPARTPDRSDQDRRNRLRQRLPRALPAPGNQGATRGNLDQGARLRQARPTRRLHRPRRRDQPHHLDQRQHHQGPDHHDRRPARDRTENRRQTLQGPPLHQDHRRTLPPQARKDRPRNQPHHLHQLEQHAATHSPSDHNRRSPSERR